MSQEPTPENFDFAGPPPMPRPNPLRRLLGHNPVFLLSALFMFLGCYLIDSALDVRTGDTAKLLGLLTTINVYEIALLALGMTLIRRTVFHRDGTLLLLTQMLFLADAPFLLAQSAMANAAWLSYFNVLLFVAAVGKSAFALRALKIPLRLRTFGFLLVQLALIYCALPLFLSHVAVDGVIDADPMYVAWWIVGMLPLAYDLLARFEKSEDLDGRQKFLRRCYVIVPWLFLIAHLGFFQYAYRAPFSLADLSPICLGIGIGSLRIRFAGRGPCIELLMLRAFLPALAIFFALTVSDPSPMFLGISAKMITTAMALITYAYTLHVYLAIAMTALVAIVALLRAYGPSAITVADQFGSFWERVYGIVTAIIPQTATAWGVVSIVAAFALLGAGAYHTLRSRSVS